MKYLATLLFLTLLAACTFTLQVNEAILQASPRGIIIQPEGEIFDVSLDIRFNTLQEIDQSCVVSFVGNRATCYYSRLFGFREVKLRGTGVTVCINFRRLGEQGFEISCLP